MFRFQCIHSQRDLSCHSNLFLFSNYFIKKIGEIFINISKVMFHMGTSFQALDKNSREVKKFSIVENLNITFIWQSTSSKILSKCRKEFHFTYNVYEIAKQIDLFIRCKKFQKLLLIQKQYLQKFSVTSQFFTILKSFPLSSKIFIRRTSENSQKPIEFRNCTFS